ncbi:hypothetical protein GGR53DRAFT_130545 [Hypoxylon sp. FL1150]|nr:hypothetical protein GGR53DRAFT_130545 [Hypoxylon sp. FL1150]
MTSPQDNATPASHPPSANTLDIVATQGAYLIPCTNTPVWHKPFYNAEFAALLDQKLRLLQLDLTMRRSRYGEAAEEWLPGYTPPKLKEEYLALVKALEEPFYIDGSDDDDNDRDNTGKMSTIQKPNETSSQADLEPPRPAESLLTIIRRRKRKYTTEKGMPKKLHIRMPDGVDALVLKLK